MALFQYFKKMDGNYPGTKLPDPQGALSKEVPSSISAANTEIAAVLQLSAAGTKVVRGTYLKISAEMKAEIGQRAAEHTDRVLATVRYYATKLPVPLKESSVRTWKNAYTAQLRRLRQDGKDNPKVKVLPSKRRGRLFLLGVEMQVRAYLKVLRANGAVVNTAITIGVQKASSGTKIAISWQLMEDTLP